MNQTYSLDEIRSNLESLRQKLKKKNRDSGFWVIASRSDFKPLVKETIKNGKTKKENVKLIDDIRKYLLEGKEKYFIGKKLASIYLWFNDELYNDSKKYNEKNYKNIKNSIGCALVIHMYVVDKNGKIGIIDRNDWICRINFTIDDLKHNKITLKIVEALMRQVEDKLVISTNMLGFNFKDYKKRILEELKNK